MNIRGLLQKLRRCAHITGVWVIIGDAALAATDDASSPAALREELGELRHQYEQRLTDLQERIKAMEESAASTAVQSRAISAVSDKAFNPAISLILNGQFGSFSNGEERRDVPGFQQGEEAGGFEEGFKLNESELNLQANIDDKFFAFASIALEAEAGETEVALEEAWLQTLALPGGLQLKAGRFFSGVGYINAFHRHATSFVDDPLVYRVFLNGRLADTGIQTTWTPPTLLYMQFGAELLAGQTFPASNAANEGVGTWAAFVKFGGDINVSHSWLASLSFLSSDANDRESGGTAEESGINPLFTGDSETWIGSVVWKWAPYGNPANTNLRLTAEYLARQEEGVLSLSGLPIDYRGDQAGYYVEGVYQFHRQWSAGIRYGALMADNRIDGTAGPLILAQDSFDPRHLSVMVDFHNSEFSTLRLQYSMDESSPDKQDRLVLQYIMSMGAHGAHAF